jgi:phage terminase large subunit GpA-like protein
LITKCWLAIHRGLKSGKLTEYAGRTFTHECGAELPITRFAIDSGAETQMVYSWVRSQDASRVLAVKGVDHGIAMVGLPSSVDITAAGKKARRAAKVWPVNVSALKSELYGWLKLDMPTVERGEPFPPGFVTFHSWAKSSFDN